MPAYPSVPNPASFMKLDDSPPTLQVGRDPQSVDGVWAYDQEGMLLENCRDRLDEHEQILRDAGLIA